MKKVNAFLSGPRSALSPAVFLEGLRVGARCCRIPAFLLLAVALLSSAATPVRAQLTDTGNVEEQSVEEQLEVVNVGDSVQVMLIHNSDARPTGVILAQDETFLRLRKERGGTQTISRRLIYALLPADVEGRTHLRETRSALRNRPDPNQARLLFGPTARTQEPGQVYLAGYEVLFPYASVGVGGLLDLRAGISALPTTVQFMYGGGKLGLVQTDAVSFAVGVVGTATTNVITVEGGQDEYGGVVYGVGTFGSPRAALTLGAGYLAAGGALREQGLAMLGGELRIDGSRVKLLTENYLLYGSGEKENSQALFGSERFGGDVNGIGSLGVRLIGANASLDVGLATSNMWWDQKLPVLPVINVSYSIGGP